MQKCTNVHLGDAVSGNLGAWIGTIWPVRLQGSFQEVLYVSGLAVQDLAAKADRMGEIDAALVF